jgi:hypothetical protein
VNFVASPAPNIALAGYQGAQPGTPTYRMGQGARTVVVVLAMRAAAVEQATARGKP